MSSNQTLVVDTVISSSQWGTVTTAILASIDGSEINGNSNADHNCHLGFDAPNEILEGATQTIRVEAAKINNKSSTPTLKIELWENGSLVTAGSTDNVTSPTFSEFTLVFDAADLTGDGTNVEIKLFGTASGSGGTKNAVAIERVIIDAVIADAAPAPEYLVLGGEGTISAVQFGSIAVTAMVFEDTVVWGSLGSPLVDYEWDFNNTVAPTKGSITLSGTATFDGNGALTHNGTVPLVMSSDVVLTSAGDWSLCIIYREHGSDGSGYSFPIGTAPAVEGLVLYTNSGSESDGSVTSYEWNNVSGADGDFFPGDIGLPATNVNVWIKLMITNTAGDITMTADGTTSVNNTNTQTSVSIHSFLALDGNTANNFEGDIAYIGIANTAVINYTDFPTIASLPQIV